MLKYYESTVKEDHIFYPNNTYTEKILAYDIVGAPLDHPDNNHPSIDQDHPENLAKCKDLTYEVIDNDLDKHKDVTCVKFIGGMFDQDTLLKLVEHVYFNYPHIKTYTFTNCKKEDIIMNIRKRSFYCTFKG